MHFWPFSDFCDWTQLSFGHKNFICSPFFLKDHISSSLSSQLCWHIKPSQNWHFSSCSTFLWYLNFWYLQVWDWEMNSCNYPPLLKCQYELRLGPLTPPQICPVCSKNNLLDIWMTKLKLDSRYLVPISSSFGPKLDQFWNLNFPSLSSDWSIQNFLERISPKFWIDQSEKR